MNDHRHHPSLRCNRGHRFRANLTVYGLLGAFLCLGMRLYYLQKIRHPFYMEYARRQQIATQVIPFHRGRILDRNGRVLAHSVTRHAVYLDPKAIGDPWRVSRSLARVLDLDPREVRRDLRTHRRRRFMWLRRDGSRVFLTREQWRRLDACGLPGIYAAEDDVRVYPNGRLAAQTIGLTNVDGRGISGIELIADGLLSGIPGVRTLRRDGRKQAMHDPSFVHRPASDGLDVMLTLDSVIQFIVEEELDRVWREHMPQGLVAVVVNPRNGQILAMANRPTFDLNKRDGDLDSQRNRAITDIYEPGSTFKPLIVAAALDHGCVQSSTVIHCHNGLYRIYGRTLHDHHPYGNLTVQDVIVKSSNIGMAKIGIKLGKTPMQQCVARWGFGSLTGVALPGEQAGMVTPREAWTAYTLTSVPMGQEIAVTPLQMTMAFSALGNGGILFQPRIILGTLDAREMLHEHAFGNRYRRVISSATAIGPMQDMMVQVVNRGTGRRAMIPDYQVMGKTGTAQKVIHGKYSDTRYVSSFVGLAPAVHPVLTVIVVVDEPSRNGYYGGQVAAPAVGRIISRTLDYMDVPPDRKVQLTASVARRVRR